MQMQMVETESVTPPYSLYMATLFPYMWMYMATSSFSYGRN